MTVLYFVHRQYLAALSGHGEKLNWQPAWGQKGETLIFDLRNKSTFFGQNHPGQLKNNQKFMATVFQDPKTD